MDVQNETPQSQCIKTFNDLPVELKEKVFEHIPRIYRWEIAIGAGSKELYNVVCSVEKFKYKLVLNPIRVRSKILIDFPSDPETF